MTVTATIDPTTKTITLTMPLQKAQLSKSSGKTMVIASTHGCQVTDARRLGRPVVVTANCFVYADNRERAESRESGAASYVREQKRAAQRTQRRAK